MLLLALCFLFRNGTREDADVSMTLAEIEANAGEIAEIMNEGRTLIDDVADQVAEAVKLQNTAISIALEQLSDEYSEHTATLVTELEATTSQRLRIFVTCSP
ncbi:hypothetical protein KO516_00690 [Citreicella sp. C3M06]|uniref:hypothetical protein n=1 Tax=Citreicella sp. C3M06 TaxID=2841564 RepID=UPI001C0971B8|nr:hypothetical protein [Citreicella sp. C3M06]MBU2959356.1 hypothetical protein [Citreicella sp. C3M06]